MILYRLLIHRAVSHCRLWLCVSGKNHGLLQRHPSIERISQRCSPESVRMRFFYPRPPSDPADNVLDTAFCQPSMRIRKPYKQSRIVI